MVAHDIVDAAEIQPGDDILEVGPGKGVLTEILLQRAAHVTAVELDEGLAEALRRRFSGNEKLTVVGSSVLEHAPDVLLAAGDRRPPYKVVANLPYYITAPILRHFLERGPRPERMVLMVQREVGEVITGKQGSLSLLGVSVHVFSQPEFLFRVPPEAFRPPPRVDSAVIRLNSLAEPAVAEAEQEAFFQIVRAGFRSPRKQLRNALPSGIWLPPEQAPAILEEAGIDPMRRPGTLDVGEWLTLLRAYERARPSFGVRPGTEPASSQDIDEESGSWEDGPV
jgi:16S rRNA (adenine1518-N6/adenine1519-N6)-dimethyltransferase